MKVALKFNISTKTYQMIDFNQTNRKITFQYILYLITLKMLNKDSESFED